MPRARPASTELAELVADAVIEVDADHRVTGWNPAAERLYGYTRPEALGRSPPS
jgi:PAS domain S-box-containing protein